MKKIQSPKIIMFLIILIFGLIVTLPILAPVLIHYGYEKPAKWIYSLYHFLCHQKAHRSLFIYDEQCAWCVRDTFIWTTIFVASVVIFRGRKIPSISWKFAALLMLPMALDGGIQLIGTTLSLFNGSTPFYESTNTIRAITGSLFGLGLSFFLFPKLKDELEGTNSCTI